MLQDFKSVSDHFTTLRSKGLKISNNLLLSETMQSFPEIIVLLEKLLLSEKYGLIVCQKILLSDTSFGFTFEK